jgi:hypothetical protein
MIYPVVTPGGLAHHGHGSDSAGQIQRVRFSGSDSAGQIQRVRFSGSDSECKLAKFDCSDFMQPPSRTQLYVATFCREGWH